MQNRRKFHAASLSVVSNATLVVLKLVVGLLTGSVSIISEAIHSGVDLLAALIAWLAVQISAKPADAEHPYGHGKFENLSGTIEAILIFLAAGWIVYEAIHKLINLQPMDQLGWGVAVMAVSAMVNFGVSNYLLRVAQETDSMALKADAYHLRTDVYTSMGVMIALAVMWGGKIFWPGQDLHWIDPLAAIMVAMLILPVAWQLTMQASSALVDMSLPADELNWLNNYLQSLAPTVRGFHNLRTRKAGSARFIDVHVMVDGHMTVRASHAITENIENDISSHFAETNVSIHIEPCDKQHCCAELNHTC